MQLAKVRSENSNVTTLVRPLPEKVVHQYNRQLYLVIVPMRCCHRVFARGVAFWYTMIKPEKPLADSYNLWICQHGWRILQAWIQRVADKLRNRGMHPPLRFQGTERDLDTDRIIRVH